MVTDQTQWPSYIALAIEKNLEEVQSGSRDSTFVLHAQDYDSRLYDPSNIEDPSLNSAWNFADQFFFAYAHNDTNMAGISWEEAFTLLQKVIGCLKNGETIVEPLVLAFQYPVSKSRKR
jgi:hypothetical protein